MTMKRVLILTLILVLIGLSLPVTVQAFHRTGPADRTVQATWTATVLVDRLNVRRAPRITSNIVGKVRLGDKLTVTGRNENALWFQIKLGSGFGWVAHEWVSLDSGDSRFSLPIVFQFPPALSVSADPRVNVRMGPSEEYPVLTRLPLNTDVDVLAVHSRPLWYQIAMPGEGPIGWVRSDMATVTGDMAKVPRRVGVPLAVITSYRVRVHTAPLLNAPVIGDVGLDEYHQIVGKDSRGNWWQIQTDFGTGWILASFAHVFGGIETLPVTVAPSLASQQ